MREIATQHLWKIRYLSFIQTILKKIEGLKKLFHLYFECRGKTFVVECKIFVNSLM